MAPGVTIGIAPILDNDLSDAAAIRTQVYFNPILEAIGTHPACNRAPMVRVIPRIPSEQHVHGVFTKKNRAIRTGLAWIVTSPSRGGAMTTARLGPESQVLWGDGEFVPSRARALRAELACPAGETAGKSLAAPPMRAITDLGT